MTIHHGPKTTVFEQDVFDSTNFPIRQAQHLGLQVQISLHTEA